MQKYISFSIFNKYPEIISGISTREYGTMKKDHVVVRGNAEKFLTDLGVEFLDTVFMRQVHSANISVVSDSRIQLIPSTDGLITTKTDIFLAVVTADCVPVVFYEPVKKIIGVAHAGYKGILKGIIEEMLETIKQLGGSVGNLLVGIGPSICGTCYAVSKERIEQFENIYSRFSGYVKVQNGENLLNLRELIQKILIEKGILVSHVECSSLCTKEDPQLYSYRRDSKEMYGEFATVIGMRSEGVRV